MADVVDEGNERLQKQSFVTQNGECGGGTSIRATNDCKSSRSSRGVADVVDVVGQV